MTSEAPQTETTVNGPHTKRWVLTGEECRELSLHRIARMGIDMAQSPYSRVRLRPGGSFVLASLEGEGRMFLEGRWQKVKAGELCLAPPRVLNALQAVPDKVWTFAWLRYDEPAFVEPMVGADSPLRLSCSETGQIGDAMRGLRTEWERSDQRDTAVCHHYISLLQRLVLRTARPWKQASRLNAVWEVVAKQLEQNWTLPDLAKICHISSEHLRRLCIRELGRTPMEHVGYIRIQRAKELLETTDNKIDVIAAEVGYRSGAVFSRAFVRYVGVVPTRYREQR